MRKEYKEPWIEIVAITQSDIITTSGGGIIGNIDGATGEISLDDDGYTPNFY